MKDLSQHIEAIIFTSEEGVSAGELKDILKRIYGFDLEETIIMENVEAIRNRYAAPEFAIELLQSGGGYQFMTKKDFHPTIAGYLNSKIGRRLSTAAMEVLAIIAYKQPVTKSEIEQIRGVNCDYSIQKLLEKELIEITGRKDVAGRPLVYSTSALFMDYFGINTMEDLPKLKEVEPEENTIGAQE